MRPLFLLLSFFIFSTTRAEVKLPRLISDGMVLQRGTAIPVWGWAAPGEKVTLTFRQQQYTTTANEGGKWMIQLPAQKAGGPYDMTITGTNTVAVKDILFGDVWLCSGQSNMELTMDRVKYKYAGIIARASNSHIRQFEVPDHYNFKAPQADIASGRWTAVTPETILRFSAVAYFFADELYRAYKVPIGLINSALGGSPAEAWISEEGLKGFPAYHSEALRFRDDNLITQIEAEGRKTQNQWYTQLNNTDEGLKNGWSAPSLDDRAWGTMQLPGYWADGPLGAVNGSVWFRKEFTVPAAMTGQPAYLELGRIVDADSVFVNGTFVGTTSYQYPPRRYTVPSGLLKAGKNIIVVRVISNGGRGGFVPGKPYQLVAGNQAIDLKGAWKYKLGATMPPLQGSTVVRWKPLGLYNAMIAPLTSYPIKGVIWYQGESNAGRPGDYTALMQTLITDWRAQWRQGDFPFLFVQLANFMEPNSQAVESQWAELRQAQLQNLSVPNTGMAVAIDLGEWNDIHPLNKQDVGKRLALQARRLAYGEKGIEVSGPLAQSVQQQGARLVVTFSGARGGLVAKGKGGLKHFAIAGSDKKFVWARAQIMGNKVVVWSESVANPVAVRYAWADNPEGANLYNKSGLPASPFQLTVVAGKTNRPAVAK